MFTVHVADNFHYMDADETYTRGAYPTWEEALAAARRLVDLSIQEGFKHGMTADALYSYYTSFGDDPFITPEPPGEHFSAWGYARARCDELCGPDPKTV